MSGFVQVASEDVEPHRWRGDLAGVDHFGVRVPDLEAGAQWYRRVLGLQADEHHNDRVFLRSPVSGQIVLALVSASGPGLEYVSYRTYGQDSLDRVKKLLAEAGISYATATADSRPGVVHAVRLPLHTGHMLELVAADADDESHERTSPAGAWDVRTSHIQLRAPDVDAMADSLEPIGFRVTTKGDTPEASLRFLRVNDRHHQMAILSGKEGIHHVALELSTPDFWKFLENLARTRTPGEYGPGRHVEGDFMFMYIRDPFGNRTEVTSEMAAVGFDYRTTQMYTKDSHAYHMNTWGPQPPESWLTEWN